MRSIGIDIGTYGVKVVDLEVGSRSLHVRDVYEVPINSDPTYDKRIPAIEILKEIASSADPTQTKFVLAIQQQHVTMRNKTFPFRERAKILKSLPFELEDDIPFNQDTAIFEAKILRYIKGGAEVLALATPNDFVADRINFSHDGGIDPDILSSEATAVATLFEDWSSPPNEPMAQEAPEEATSTELSFHPDPAKLLLHIGHERTVLCAFHNGAILTARTIFFGGLNILKSIQKQYNIPYAEALKGFTEKGFILSNKEGATQDQIAFSDSITKSLDDLIEEVRRDLLEIQTEFKVRVAHIDVSGGVATLPNLCNWLTQSFEIPCNLIKPFGGMGRSDITDALGSRCTIALGLALEGARRPINPAVNFRKGDFSKENQSFKVFLERWSYTAKLAGVAVAGLYLFAFLRDPLASALTTASATLLRTKAQEVGMKRSQSGPSHVTKYVRDQDREIKRRKSLSELQGIQSAMSIMNKLSQIVPNKDEAKLDVRRFYVLNDVLTLEGDVASPAELPKLQQALVSLSSSKQVVELSPTLPKRNNRTAFAFQLRVDRRGNL